MICLACGAENEYGSRHCASCEQRFDVFPPFIKANHVSQLQQALGDCIEGELSAEELAERYAVFTERFGRFDEQWGVAEGGSLRARLSEPLVGRFGEGVAELDRGLALLFEALGTLEQGLESGEGELLAQARSQLTDFFRVTCGGCALLMKQLEDGTRADVGSFLDVKGL